LHDRLRNKSLKERLITPSEAAEYIKNGMTVAASGFTPSGYPKAIPLALAERVAREGNIHINLLTGASVGNELDGVLAEKGIISRRYPYHTNKILRDRINQGAVSYKDIHLGHFPQQIRYGFFGKIDLALIEAAAITEEGGIIPTTSVGASPTFVSEAEKILIELNTSQPLELEGIHDIYYLEDPPARKPIPLISPYERIGSTYIPIETEKILGIVVTDIKDGVRSLPPGDDSSDRIAAHLIEFLYHEVKKDRLPHNLLPIQSGVGSTANAVLRGLLESPFENMDFYSEVIQDSVLDLLDSRKLNGASGTSLTFSEAGLKRFYKNIEEYKHKIILRPQEISNHAEIIRRLGSIAINTAVEVDIYGHINSTNIFGSDIINGIGGSGDFTRNAYLSIFTTPSTLKNGSISCIVPMVSHVDHTEHDVHIVVTEQGLADIRGLSPRERAGVIIENCAHPDYKPILRDYYRRSLRKGGHMPHDLQDAFSLHNRFIEIGSMRD